jgi:hypothetical protein
VPRWRPGKVQRLGAQLRLELGLRKLLAPALQGGLDARLGLVDLGAAGFLLLGRQRAETLEQFGQAAVLAQVTRLGIFQGGSQPRGRKIGLRSLHQVFEIVHVLKTGTKKGRHEVTAFGCLKCCRRRAPAAGYQAS